MIMNNPFAQQEQARPYADHELSALQEELERLDREAQELTQKKQELAVCQSQIKNEIIQRMNDDNLKSLSTDTARFSLTRRKNVKINEKDPDLLDFAKKYGYVIERPDTKAIEKTIDPENPPEWATVSKSEYIKKVSK